MWKEALHGMMGKRFANPNSRHRPTILRHERSEVIDLFSIRFAHHRTKVPPTWHIPSARTSTHILLFLLEGTVTYRFGDDAPVSFERNDLVYIPIDTQRSAAACPPRYHQMCSAHFLLDDAGLPPLPMLGGREVKRVRPQNTEYVRQRFSALLDASHANAPYADWHCRSILLELLVLMNRELDWSRYHPDKLAMVRAMQSFIEAHYREKITLRRLSAVVDRSPNYACHLFKEVTGLGPIEYANQIRLNRARDLLSRTEDSVADVAERVGFGDPYYFSKLYKRAFGVSPKRSMLE